jgi:hypothetical protein
MTRYALAVRRRTDQRRVIGRPPPHLDDETAAPFVYRAVVAVG